MGTPVDMGTPVRILDLARSLIQLSGKKEDEVEIEFKGLRPGEKLIEELFYSDEVVCNTSCPKIKKARNVLRGWNKLESQLDDLELLCISTVRLPFVQKLSKSFLSIPVIQPRFIH